MKWYYQFSPHDEVDYDSTQVPVLADINWQGRSRKVMLWANRNGVAYVFDRLTGEFLLGKPFVKVNAAALPSELLFSQEQIAALDAEHEKSEKQRRARARSGRDEVTGDSGLTFDYGGDVGDGGGCD